MIHKIKSEEDTSNLLKVIFKKLEYISKNINFKILIITMEMDTVVMEAMEVITMEIHQEFLLLPDKYNLSQ